MVAVGGEAEFGLTLKPSGRESATWLGGEPLMLMPLFVCLLFVKYGNDFVHSLVY